MGTKQTWLLDLSGLTLFENDYSPDNLTWLQALPLGEYQHPRYGKLSITPDKVARMASNIQANVRGTELDIDYDHKEHSGKAAGWVKNAEARNDGLWLAVSWTEDAYASLKKGEYKYFSSEYEDMWTHPKSKVKHQDVLFGGAITNRPFIKDILPINLSEVLGNKGGPVGEELMKLLRKKYQLAEDANETAIFTAIALDEDQDEEVEDEDEDESEEETDEETELSEEDDPRIKQLMDANKEQAKRLAILEIQNRKSETKRKLAEINVGASKFAIPPVALEELEKVLIRLDDKDQDQVLKAVSSIRDKGLVELKERGSSNPDNEAGDETKRLWDQVEKLRKDNKELSETDALVQIMESNPKLYEAYRDASYLKPKGE